MWKNDRNLTKEQLLELENKWRDREDEENPSWILEGIRLFNRLSHLDKKETRYQEMLAYLYLLEGEDWKIKRLNYKAAIKCFNHVIRYDRTNARAYYRMGFLYFYLNDWTKAIESFQQSLLQSPRYTRNELTKEQKMKAHYYILKGAQIIIQETLQQLDTPKNEPSTFPVEMKELIIDLKNGLINNKPYIMIIDGIKTKKISEDEYALLTDPFQQYPNYFIFNQRSLDDNVVIFANKELNIPQKQAPLLEYLMRYPNGVKSFVLTDNLYRHSRNPNDLLRRKICRLRQKLREIDPTIEFIETIENGYRLNGHFEYRIFKHQRNIGTELLVE